MTMQKNYASNYYFFNEQFFKKTMDRLQGHIVIVNAIYRNETIGTAMFMYYEDFLHYHFSATNPEYYKFACNNLILSEMVKWGKHNGINYFHLGGGHTTASNDSLLSFKKSFSKNEFYEFWIGKRIHDLDVYQKLVELTSQIQTNKNISYFPLYRTCIK
jgi:lipid II:glycine glycyltransferase (peptidoglycan interpeptide bridge formation enzyme)